MAYFSLHAYDADVRIPAFAGLRQDSETANDLRFACEAENVETPNGVLQPQAGYGFLPDGFENHKIETLMQFHRRWYEGDGSKDWLIAAVNGKLYNKQKGTEVPWDEIGMPSGLSSFTSNVWSWVTYEVNIQQDPSEPNITVDVVLISNGKDGMFMVQPPDKKTTWRDVKEQTWGVVRQYTWQHWISRLWTIQTIHTREYKFGVIERYAERIWGGNITDHPDTLVYSAVYAPDDWRAYSEGAEETDDTHDGQPEDGSGEINQPSWDGDSFTALKAFGNQLIAFKGNRVWRVMGISPGEYTFNEQYGGGTLYPFTVAVNAERILMAERDGLSYYDGMTVSPFMRGYIQQFWRKINRSAMDQMVAVLHKRKYYLAVPTGESEVNNTLLVFDVDSGSFIAYTDMYIESIVSSGDQLYATSSRIPGKVMEIGYNSWEAGECSGQPTRWETPWMDFSYKTIAKGGFEIYFNPEVKGGPVTFRFTIRTEKKSKSKLVTIQPTVFKEKQKRIRFGGTSRKFKLIIETLQSPTHALWRLNGGIHMVVETDPD